MRQRPRKLNPPGRFTQNPPRELTVTGPMRFDAEAPLPEKLIQLFFPVFLRERKFNPMRVILTRAPEADPGDV